MESLTRYKVAVPDDRHWREEIKCQTACPVHTDARGYVRAIAHGDVEKAYLIARGPNPLASICGSICGAPCEAACRRGDIDRPVSIRALKRYVCESPERETLDRELDLIAELKAALPGRECSDEHEAVALTDWAEAHALKTESGATVAIIGSGPAGLAAAHDLALLGLRPIIFEREDVPAGMLYLGVPEYRLPREIIRAEVGFIEALGVEIRTGVQVGVDVTLPELLDAHAAVIMAIGARNSRRLPIRGAEGDGVIGGVEFLREVALGRSPRLGRRVVVIGGGNVAYDVSRSAVRQGESPGGADDDGGHDTRHDISRSALRRHGVETVHLCCLESRDEMLADDREIIEGAQENIRLHNSLGPDEILLDEKGCVRGVRFKKVLSIFDDQGRFAPTYDENDTVEIEADSVLLSIGQESDFSLLEPDRDGVDVGSRGYPVLNEEQSTTRQGLFVAGDAAYGTKLMIHAIASGKDAARSVYEYVTGRRIAFEVRSRHTPIEGYAREDGYECLPREDPPILEREERLTDAAREVEQRYDQTAAHRAAGRCLDCGVNTVFDGAKCILCGGCVDVCPEMCLQIVSLDRLSGDNVFQSLLDTHHYPNGAGAIIKNDVRCTRCSLCAIRCPVGAITMERFQFECAAVGT